MPKHADKSDLHRNNMAIRYAVKQFLTDHYVAARTMEGLPVSPTYAEAKLGLIHGVSTVEKTAFYKQQAEVVKTNTPVVNAPTHIPSVSSDGKSEFYKSKHGL